jgi:hypothetical protein
MRALICLAGAALVLGLLIALMTITPHKEGFESPDATPMTTQQLSQQLLAAVMPPIRRISSMILNPNVWKDQLSMINLTPTEMARHYLRNKERS